MSNFNREYTEDQLFVLNDIADEQERVMREEMEEVQYSQTLNDIADLLFPIYHVKN